MYNYSYLYDYLDLLSLYTAYHRKDKQFNSIINMHQH